ncbi:MAG: M56 family metallopeptidase, partial [Pseudomonadota bacterium]|nr:M56 family metallopeptidase [Pseudomonadota bacterium]
IDWAFWGYAVPAAVLILLTLIALGRLALLKARASVLLDPHWLCALAQAQSRMGFKNGTALLTSDELSSPISWGLMRPVILLNTDATLARAEAEAIVAHELAHVARLDWAKLVLARVTVALFWFNPLVWLLSREAHQLREEAADDAVLGADIEDTDYANLLVGIARHECRGLLLGAHGVAPARNSLARRVKRVLNAATERAPGGWRWGSAAAFVAAGMTVPVAALQFVSPTMATAAAQGRFVAAAPAQDPISAIVSKATAQIPMVSETLSGAVTGAVGGAVTAAAHPHMTAEELRDLEEDIRADVVRERATGWTGIGPEPGTPPIPPRPPSTHSVRAIDNAIAMKAVGATPDYLRAIRRAAPHLRLDAGDAIALKAVGVTPEYVRDLGRSGYNDLNAGEIASARALGIDGAYIRGMTAAGFGRLPMDKLVQMKAVGVTPSYAAQFRRGGRDLPSADKIVELRAVGLDPDDVDLVIELDDDDGP